jgi:hypothetical protein
MLTLNRGHMLIIYGITLLFVHISSNGFRTNVPLVYTMPLIALCGMGFCTRMQWNKQVATIGSFLSLAIGVFHWTLSPKNLTYRAVPFCISHILYLYTFWGCVRKFWAPLGVVLFVYSAGLIYFCVGDLFRSLPLLVISVAADLFTISLSLFAAGSLWKNGVKGNRIHEARMAAFLRFVGLCVELLCGSALILNHFVHHNNFHQYMIYYYVAQFLLFVSNEQTF